MSETTCNNDDDEDANVCASKIVYDEMLEEVCLDEVIIPILAHATQEAMNSRPVDRDSLTAILVAMLEREQENAQSMMQRNTNQDFPKAGTYLLVILMLIIGIALVIPGLVITVQGNKNKDEQHDRKGPILMGIGLTLCAVSWVCCPAKFKETTNQGIGPLGNQTACNGISVPANLSPNGIPSTPQHPVPSNSGMLSMPVQDTRPPSYEEAISGQDGPPPYNGHAV